jgi:MFS family permease
MLIRAHHELASGHHNHLGRKGRILKNGADRDRLQAGESSEDGSRPARRTSAAKSSVGGLGGFVLPILFGLANDLTGVWQSCFMLLFAISLMALVWMHFAIRQMEREAAGVATDKLPELPEMQEIHEARHVGVPGPHLITDWRPEDKEFWDTKGRAIARRNLLISIPALLLSFAVWMVWSVVVAKLPSIGFASTTDQLFWLAAVPGLSGATLRIFYSFMVPVLGGRLWTTLTTWSLIVPALGIGMAVQNPATPYWLFLLLALLCGFGGGNFASSMSNISFFFPKAEKGNALALNAGLGNLGVSVVQFVVPLAITAGVFGWLGGEPQTAVEAGRETKLWLQNAASSSCRSSSPAPSQPGSASTTSPRPGRRSPSRRSSSSASTTGSCAGSTPAPSARSSATRRASRCWPRSSSPRPMRWLTPSSAPWWGRCRAP